MSNKLKTLSASQLEEIISREVGNYIHEDCECEVTDISTPRFGTENEEDTHDENDLSFSVRISYHAEE
jgi:hypothetical protein